MTSDARWFPLALSCFLVLLPAWAATQDGSPSTVEANLEDSQVLLRRLQAQLDGLQAQFSALQAEQAASAELNQQQSQQLQALQRGLGDAPGVGAQSNLQALRATLIDALSRNLPQSRYYALQADRLVIPADPLFGVDSVTLDDADRARREPLGETLGAALTFLPPDQPWRLLISGHTDLRAYLGKVQVGGSWDQAGAWAAALAGYLRERGVPGERLLVISRADEIPAGGGADLAAFKRNRRVEIILSLE